MTDKIRVADEVWIATALLHRENPERESFTPSEIIDRVAKENIFGRIRPGVMVHVSQHCVASKRPNPGTYRMLTVLEDRTRRLFREGDPYHEWRDRGKMRPHTRDIDEVYRGLIHWWESEYNKGGG